MTTRKQYPSDITREQFEIIRPLLEQAKKKTKPRVYDSYDIFCGAIYVLKTACQWRALPSDFPKWQNVYKHFMIWSKKKENSDSSLLDEILKKISS